MFTVKTDGFGNSIQSFLATPAACQVPAVINAAATHTIVPSTLGVSCIQFRSVSGPVDVYFNTDTTKVMTFDGDEIFVLLLDDTVTAVNFKNNGAAGVTLQLWGQ
jgi:hypothetical protein